MRDRDWDDGIRSDVLRLLQIGPQGIGEIKRYILEHRPSDVKDAEVATAAGRSQFDVKVWGIMSSLCNAGLAKSTGVRRFHITKDGKKMCQQAHPKISAELLKKGSEDYRRLTTEPDPAETAPTPKCVPVKHKDGIVAMIDMLGTRELDGTRCTIQAHNSWNALLSYANHLVKEEVEMQGCKIAAFSDTMFVTADGNAETLLGAFGRVCTRLIPKSIYLDIPIRGCVAVGKFYQSDCKLFTGPAVKEAAAYYELPQWIGISSCPSAYNKIDGLSSGRGCYTKYDVPLSRSVEYGGLVVNWPDRYNHEHADREKELDCILSLLEKRMERTSSVGASLKWRNTRDFLCTATGVEGRPVRSSTQSRLRQTSGTDPAHAGQVTYL